MELGLILRNRSVDMEASVIDSYRQYKVAVADIEAELEEVRPALVEYLTSRGGKITDGGASLQLVEVTKLTWDTPALLELLLEFNIDQSVAGDWTIKATDANLNRVATGLYDWLEELDKAEDRAEVIFRRIDRFNCHPPPPSRPAPAALYR